MKVNGVRRIPYVHRVRGCPSRPWKVQRIFYGTDHHFKRKAGDRRPEYTFLRKYKEKWAAIYVAKLVNQLLSPGQEGILMRLRFTDTFIDALGNHFLYVHGDKYRTSILVDPEVMERISGMAWGWHSKRKGEAVRPHTIIGIADRTKDPWTLHVEWVGIEWFIFPEEDFTRKRVGALRPALSDPRDYRASAYSFRQKRTSGGG